MDPRDNGKLKMKNGKGCPSRAFENRAERGGAGAGQERSEQGGKWKMEDGKCFAAVLIAAGRMA
jgi:hypothetical protein